MQIHVDCYVINEQRLYCRTAGVLPDVCTVLYFNVSFKKYQVPMKEYNDNVFKYKRVYNLFFLTDDEFQ